MWGELTRLLPVMAAAREEVSLSLNIKVGNFS